MVKEETEINILKLEEEGEIEEGEEEVFFSKFSFEEFKELRVNLK